MITPEDRYKSDPVFRNLVDLLGSFLEDNAMRQWTPTELREAVLLAACRYEYVHVRPITYVGISRDLGEPKGQCSKCGRKTWDSHYVGLGPCNMPQPDGSRCDGHFVSSDDTH